MCKSAFLSLDPTKIVFYFKNNINHIFNENKRIFTNEQILCRYMEMGQKY